MCVFKLLIFFFILGSEGFPQNSSRTEEKGGYRIWNGEKSELLPYQVMVVVKRRRCFIMNNEIMVAIVCSLPVALCLWIVGVYTA